MSSRKRNQDGRDLPCDELYEDDLVDPRRFFRSKEERGERHKTQQLCEQIARSLRHALAWEVGDPLLATVIVTAVEPPPRGGPLIVSVHVPGAASEAVLEHLKGISGYLRSLVARDIHRRKVPELSFRWQHAEEAEDGR